MQIPPDYLPPQILHQDHNSYGPHLPLPQTVNSLNNNAASQVPLPRQIGASPNLPAPRKPSVMIKQVQQLDCPPPRLLTSKAIMYRKIRPPQMGDKSPCASTAWFRGRVIEMLIEDTGDMPGGIYAGDVLEFQELKPEGSSPRLGVSSVPQMPYYPGRVPPFAPQTPLFQPLQPHSTMPFRCQPESPQTSHPPSMRTAPPKSAPSFLQTDATLHHLPPNPNSVSSIQSSSPYARSDGKYKVTKKIPNSPSSGTATAKQTKVLKSLLNRLNEPEVDGMKKPASKTMLMPPGQCQNSHPATARTNQPDKSQNFECELQTEGIDQNKDTHADLVIDKHENCDELELTSSKPQLEQISAYMYPEEPAKGNSFKESYYDYVSFDEDCDSSNMAEFLDIHHYN